MYLLVIFSVTLNYGNKILEEQMQQQKKIVICSYVIMKNRNILV
jgi:hypothetical protein